MPIKIPTIPLLLALLVLLAPLCDAQTIDFETVGGFPASDDTVLSDQFRSSHGVRFRLDSTGNGLPDAKLPRIEATGADGTDAFVGFGGSDAVGLGSVARLGDFFLRSHLSRDAGANAPLSLIILYDAPVSAASAEIWDIDGFTDTEQWQVDAMGAAYLASNDVADVVDSVLSPVGNSSLLNGKPWTFSFDHHGNEDIHAIRIQFVGSKTGSIGFGFDNFSPSASADEVDNCAPGLPPVRSSRHNGANQGIVVYQHEPQFNASVETTIEAWVFRESATRVETIVSQDLDSGLCFGFFPNLRFYRSGGSPATVPVTAPAERWTHVAVSYDGTTARFYIDGEPVGVRSLSNSGTGGTQPLFLGGEASGLPFQGCLDEVRIWSVVRTEAQIRNGMYREIRSAPGLAAVFPEGGVNEALAGLRGTAPIEPQEKVWGMLPHHLVVPRVDSVNFDGEPIVATEYEGAEEIPIRYDTGPDGHAYLVYTDNPGDSDDKLYVGLTNLRDPADGINRNDSKLAVYLDRGRMRRDIAGSQDFRFQMSMATGAQAESEFIGNGLGSWRTVAGLNFDEILLAGSYRIKSIVPGIGEFYPTVFEYQISKPIFGDFDNPAGFAISHINAEGIFDIDMAPSDAVFNSPATWTCLTFGDAVDRPTTRPNLRVRVRDTISGDLLPGYQFWILDSGTGEVLADLTTPASGYYDRLVTLPADRPFRIQIPGCSYCSYSDPVVGSTGIQPISTSTLEADFPGMPEGSGSVLAAITFQVELPLPPIVFTSIEESSAPVPTVMRTTPDLKVVPEVSTITLHGEYFHDQLEVYLYNCLNMPPVESSTCQEGIHYILCEVDSILGDRTEMVVRLPEAPPGTWDIAIHDKATRPGVLTPQQKWTRRGPIILTRPDYPQLYGFEFFNKADNREFDGQAWKHFAAVFQNSIYRPGAFCAPDPMYGVFFGIFGAVDRSINGTCVGFASTSRLFLLGDLDSNDFGALYPFGLPGVLETNDEGDAFLMPPQPDRYSWRGPCRGYRPRNLWGHLRRNHMVQLSHESIEALFDQVDGRIRTGGDPRAVFDRLVLDKNYVISMTRSGGGHAVTPIRVHTGFEVSDDSYSMTPDSTPVSWDPGIPRYRTIEIYDNNYPGSKRFIGIDWETNQFFYQRSGSRPDYTGKSIFTLPISIWRNSRARPRIIRDGFEILYEVVAGDANVEHEDASGNKWGWDADGNFQEDYPGAKTMFLMDGLEDQTQDALFFPPPGTVPDITRIRGGGGDYCFHADQGSVMVQLHANSTPGKADAISLETDPADKLCGLQFTPQSALSDVRACIATEFNANETAAFDLSGMDLVAKKKLTVELVQGARAVVVKNDAAQAITYDLKVNAADYSSDSGSDRDFGQVTVPAGATQSIALTNWPGNANVRAETDLDSDGTPDITTLINALPGPELRITRTGSELDVTWDHIPGTTLISSSDLVDWSPVGGVVIDGSEASYSTTIPAGGGNLYFQLFR